MKPTLKSNLEKIKKLIQERKQKGLTREAQKIRSQLLSDNFPLIIELLSKYNTYSNITEDEIQNGYLGLLETIDKFNPEKASSLGALGKWRIMYNCFKYKEHTGGVKIPKHKSRDYKYYTKSFVEDRMDVEDDSQTKKLRLERIADEASKILDPELELPVFNLKTFSKVTYKDLQKKFGLNRSELSKIYNKARVRVINHCKEVFEDAVN